MQQSAQCNRAKAVWVGFASFRKLKYLLGNNVSHGVGLVFELKRFARHPMGHAHGFQDLRLNAVYQAPRTPKVTHCPPHVVHRLIPWFRLDLVADSSHFSTAQIMMRGAGRSVLSAFRTGTLGPRAGKHATIPLNLGSDGPSTDGY
jgi:hypothetical protein